MTYQDFDLLIGPGDSGYRATVQRSPAGEAQAEFTLPFTGVRLENVLLRLGRVRRARTRRVESSQMQTAKSFGGALFGAVFSGAVGECFQASRKASRGRRQGLRIRLRLGAPGLFDVPWEFLYNPAVNRFLALSIQTPIVRYIDLPDPARPLPVDGPIRALVVIASPSDYAPLDTAAEWEHLTAAVRQLRAGGALVIERMDEASLPELQRRLRGTEYHILHFIGHGDFDQAHQEGVLIFEDAQGRGHRVGSQHLGMLLHDHPTLRLAILNACEGARTSRLDPFAGSAQSLVQQGIPAVVAMQFEIADDVASVLARELYGALADSYPVDAALTEARKAIFATGCDVAWATPVLYLRAPDGRIFEVERRTPIGRPVPPPEPAGATSAGSDPVEASPASGARELIRAADAALANGRYEEAQAFLQQARQLDPDARNLRELLDVAEQQRAVAEIRARRRGRARADLRAASARLAGGDARMAWQLVRRVLEARPGDPEALALLGRVRQALDALPAPAEESRGAAPGPAPGTSGHEGEPASPDRAHDEGDLLEDA